ncbi:hypothetical protein FEM03_06550 [Phragmitibacter flavus]|uniref:Protein kinase domain-containing protein n=1 Tax=Phragmitibacter flavus TaxID=2576071 RepID=A0A5R8KHK2_9BACT|nr:right-handed parallel beta-helix repeat-containing protein [Phragmitibacter flavus]TLD71793.1 hypothetical protein FEM03_06550 [Phragmitibacter flavus]
MADEVPPINLDDIDFGPTMRGHQKGDRVFDRFMLQKLLGRGGMGVVWLALDERLKREVALKFAPQLIRYDEVAVEELKDETRKGLLLGHPHIVKTYDFLLDEENAAISMEFIDGESLAGLRAKQPKRIFEVREIEKWVAQLLAALGYAHHSVGVIHRDLKPANLMVDRAGDLKVTDFGIARSITDAINRATLAVGNSTGTLAYMSPQQADGRKPEITDDLYAFASTIYELLTGKPPFHSGNIGLQLRHEAAVSATERRAEFGLTDLEVIPPIWEETLLACLDKDPAKRPADAGEIAALLGLEAVVGTMPVARRPPALPKEVEAGSVSQPVIAPPPVPKEVVAAKPTEAETKSKTPSVENEAQGGSGMVWLWVALVMLMLAVGALGASGWWIYHNTPFFKGKQEVVKDLPKKVEEDPQPTPEPEPTPDPEPVPVPVDPKPMVETKPDVPTPPKPTPDPVPEPEPAPAAPVFTTIQNAIRTAKPGETISIPDGIYDEQVRLQNGVKLKAATAGKVIVQADGESGPALLAEGCRDVSISGLVFQHTGLEVSDEKTWPVVYLKASSVVLSDCTVEKGVGDGVVVTGTGQVELKKCVFRNNVGHGLVLESGATAQVTGCELRKNGGSGAAVRFIGTAPTFAQCVFEGNGGSGAIVVDAASATFGDGTVAKGNVEAGLAADGDGVSITVQGATCENNLVGISVLNGALGSIRGSTLRECKEAGLVFDGASNDSVAEANIVEKNKLFGIFATGAADGVLRLSDNKSSANGGHGITVFGKGFKPEVTSNTCTMNAQHGIFVAEGCAGTITGNTVSGNHLTGIGTEDTSPDLVVRDNILE